MIFLANYINQITANRIIFVFEIIVLIVTLLMIMIAVFQDKEFQTGLAALNGGNDELFANSKERGKQKVLSVTMLVLGIIWIITVCICLILSNTIIVS